jgi:hypothetical protein
LYTRRRFSEGDRGGNYLFIEHDYKLHGYWDDQISTEEPYTTVRRLAAHVGQNDALSAAGQRGAGTLDPGDWIDEGHELAKKYVYTRGVLETIAAREDHFHLGSLRPLQTYYADAETISEQQAVVAAHRLAALLTQLLH